MHALATTIALVLVLTLAACTTISDRGQGAAAAVTHAEFDQVHAEAIVAYEGGDFAASAELASRAHRMKLRCRRI